MPVIPRDIAELNFSDKDLFLDVRLTSVGVNEGGSGDRDLNTGFIKTATGNRIDFTGRPTFRTGFFRDGTGFGITNIKIVTNASLQPTIDIEFKDLYGKTVFGELSGLSNEETSYKVLFQWPPPKFEFTFKGYLGGPVTWILNMKTTSTDYNSDDGSYTIKATFIPNQWGMFADIPFLFLFAVKGLKSQSLGKNVRTDTALYKKQTESIIDYMYSGKKVQVIKEQFTKEYDDVVGALQGFKGDAINAIIGGLIKFDDEEGIISAIPGRGELAGFKKIKLQLPKDYEDLDEGEVIVRLKAAPPSARANENRRIKAATLGEKEYQEIKGPNGVIGYADDDPSSKEYLRKEAKKFDGILDKNLEIVDSAIKANLYESNKEDLERTTIKSIFRRIAKDTAYIMGYVIDAGEQGYFNNKSSRDNAEKDDLIGLFFPMKFEEVENKEVNDSLEKVFKQVPAGSEYGTPKFEKLFVENFVAALAIGIAQNRALQSAAESGGENKIKFRVNNLELIADNPFINIIDWKQIASIIMKRAGIAGYLTAGNDPNFPGNYPNEWFWAINQDEMRKMADGDLANITDAVLGVLEPEDLEQLRTFCLFWMGLINAEEFKTSGVNLTWENHLWRGGNAKDAGHYTSGFNLNTTIFVKSPGEASLLQGNSQSDKTAKNIITYIKASDDIWSPDNRMLKDPIGVFKKLLNNGSKNMFGYTGFDKSSSLWTSLRSAGFEAWTVEEYLSQFIGQNYLFYGRSSAMAANSKKRSKAASSKVVEPTLAASSYFRNTLSYYSHFNGITFTHTANSKAERSELIEFVLFTDKQDVQAVAEITPVNPSDSEVDSIEEEEKDENLEDEYPLGITVINDPEKLQDPEKGADESVGIIFTERNAQTHPGITFYDSQSVLQFCHYSKAVSRKSVPFKIFSKKSSTIKDYAGEKWNTINERRPEWLGVVTVLEKEPNARATQTTESGVRIINTATHPVAFAPYAQIWNTSEDPCPTGGFFGTSDYATASRTFLRQFCRGLEAKIVKLQEETSKIFGQILGRAGEHEDLLYQQFHTIFHQWQILGSVNGKQINSPSPTRLTANAALELERLYGQVDTKGGDSEDGDIDIDAGKEVDSTNDGNEVISFRYDFPLQAFGDKVNVANSIINIEPLYNAKANTTVLNIFQQVCSKNNFMFFPIPGNSRYKNIQELFRPLTTVKNPKVGNFFQILFNPTPESRTLNANSDEAKSVTSEDAEDSFSVDAFPVAFGDPENKIIKNVTVGTDDNKVTAESIVNLQRIVDNEEKNRTVTTDCSLLSVFEGRSYKAKIETMGNAQISPMQFFYLKNHTIFTGLYQIIKVEHSITPNDMTTDFTGIKMRYAGGSYGGVVPVTLDDFITAAKGSKNAPLETDDGGFEDLSALEAAALEADPDRALAQRQNDAGVSGEALEGGSKTVAGYLKNATQKANIDGLITEAVAQGITDPKTIAGILAICSKESSLVPQFENLYYSLERAYEVWPRLKKIDTSKAFNPKTKKSDSEQYRKELCKIVYGKTYGNDGYDKKAGLAGHKILDKWIGPYTDGYDGYRYRGGGYNQITFKSAYTKAKETSGVDVVTNPELIIKRGTAEKVCIAFFKRRIETFPSSKAAEWNAIDGNSPSVSFNSIGDAVFYTYHCNTGTGKSVATVRALNDPSHHLGGMQKAQARAPFLLEYVEQKLGLPVSNDGKDGGGGGNSGGLPFTGPTPNADKLRATLKELGYTEKGREISNGGDISVGITDAIIEILKTIKEKHPSYAIKLTGGNDEYHQKLGYNSRHKTGYAMDFVVTPSGTKDLDNIVAILESFTKKYKPSGFYIDEYRNLSDAGTAGHFHVSLK